MFLQITKRGEWNDMHIYVTVFSVQFFLQPLMLDTFKDGWEIKSLHLQKQSS